MTDRDDNNQRGSEEDNRSGEANNPDEKADGAKGEAKRRRSRANKVGKVFTGEILVGEKSSTRYPLLLYCAFLVLLYILYVYSYQHLQRQIIIERDRLATFQSRYSAQQADLINLTTHSAITAEVERRGLGIGESPEPPLILTE